ncbi:hypothetical protein [Streptomyces sp. NRRL S-37]|uniref:hypothetical protein n=1 Tax=Streptomyces sp. NRRL S-37 TaxID=1463903 RepID=UPI000D14603C|nr:hypothetical protein [Streptomyces sp. NRRL S-37]
MMKNPPHTDWSTEWLHGGLHTLGGLEETLSGHTPPARWRETKQFRTNTTGPGRNHSIFETARTRAYREVHHHFDNPGILHTTIHAEAHTPQRRTHETAAGHGDACNHQQHPPGITTRPRTPKDGTAVGGSMWAGCCLLLDCL